MRNLLLSALLISNSACLELAQAGTPLPPKSLKEYFKDNTLVVSRQAFYNTNKSQRVEYHCEDESGPGGANEGANNPANQHCEATLFTQQSGKWMFGDEIDLRYGSVKEFTGHKLVVEVLEYGNDDALCCPSETSTRVFNTESGKFVENISLKRKAVVIQAVKNGMNQKHIAQLIDHGADINAKDEHGLTALMLATENGNAEIIKLLLEHKADINAIRNNGKTALIIAADKGSVEIVKLLLDKGANPNIQDNQGRSALFYAIQKGSRDIFLLLLGRGADVNAKTKDGDTPLRAAIAAHANAALVELLLDKGANTHTTYEGSTILNIAAKSSQCKIVRLLLDRGASANESNWGTPVLFSAAGYSKDTDCLKALVEKGADINVRDSVGQTPLFIAAEYGPVANVEWLLRNGANPNVVAYGMTLLEAARKMGSKDVVAFLEKQLHQ